MVVQIFDDGTCIRQIIINQVESYFYFYLFYYYYFFFGGGGGGTFRTMSLMLAFLKKKFFCRFKGMYFIS